MSMTCGICRAESYQIKSPNGIATLTVSEEKGTLYYELSDDGKVLIKKSSIGIVPGAMHTVKSDSITRHESTWKPVYGQFSSIRDNHSQLKLDLDVDGKKVALIARLFNDGMGMRFVVNGVADQTLELTCDYELIDSDTAYFPNEIEWEPIGPLPVKGGSATMTTKDETSSPAPSCIPIVIKRSAESYIALLESDLYSATGFEAMAFGTKKGMTGYTSSSPAKTVDGETLTPWRVVLFGKSAGSLLTSPVSINLAAPCKLEDTSWVKPGKGLWDWRIHGYDNGTFKYDVNTQSYIHLIDFCADQDITYLTIDANWFNSGTTIPFEVNPNVDMEKVMQYARDNGVRIKLYYDRKKGHASDEELFPYYEKLQASGMKYGFMGNKADFTRAAIDAAARHKMVVNFHDAPCPMVGVERTMPHLISREYCHAQQDGRRAFTPRSFLKMAMINALTGPLDQANGNFGIKSINAGLRKKSPKKKNSYVSTVVSECARTLVIFSGLVTLPDAPEEYMKKADLFEFLKRMPGTWDETVVLNSSIAEYITTARRSGDTWFVGSVNNENARTLPIKCDFLNPGMVYTATLFEDAVDSHGVKNPEAYEIRKIEVKKGDVINAVMAVGGGHAMRVIPK